MKKLHKQLIAGLVGAGLVFLGVTVLIVLWSWYQGPLKSVPLINQVWIWLVAGVSISSAAGGVISFFVSGYFFKDKPRAGTKSEAKTNPIIIVAALTLAFLFVAGLIAIIFYGLGFSAGAWSIIIVIGGLAVFYLDLWKVKGVKVLSIAFGLCFVGLWLVIGLAYLMAGQGWLNSTIFAGIEMGLMEAAIILALYHLDRLFKIGRDRPYEVPWLKTVTKLAIPFLLILVVSTIVMTLLNDQLLQFGLLGATGLAGAAFVSQRHAAEEEESE